MHDFLRFRRMVTPTIIQVLFWIGIALCVIWGIGAIIGGIVADRGGGMLVLFGLLELVLGPLFVRVYCEILILMFRMYDALTEIKKNTEPGAE